jgi:signal transduction histidine kinase
VEFGLEEGGELKVETTLCNEIRDHRRPIVIDNVAEDLNYNDHHTPQMYGLKSYVSFPILLPDGRFFGTLCAIDSKPAQVNNPKVIGTFKLFTELLSFHLQSLDLLERSYASNVELQNTNRALTSANFDLDNFVYTASHDLKSPVANIEGLIEILSEAVAKEELDREEINQITAMMKSSLQRFATTIKDLTSIVEIDKTSAEEEPEALNIFETLETVKQDLENLIAESEAKIEVISEDALVVNFSKKNFKSILYNLLSNALKYRSPERSPEIEVKLEKVKEKTQLTVKDNGLGISAGKQDTVFTMFKRLHDHVEGSGLGLYIVKRMVDNVQGDIRVHSKVDEGTTFTIIF